MPQVRKVLPIYKQKFRRECDGEPVWEDRFREELWREALLRLMNAMVWISADEAVDFFIPRSLELFLFNRELVHELYRPFKKFLAADKKFHKKNRRRINALMAAVDDFRWYAWFDTDREWGRVIDFCRQALDNWKPEPLHRSLLQLILGRCHYHLKDNGAALQALLEQVDDTTLEKSGQDKLATALDDVGTEFSLNEHNIFFFSPEALQAFEKAVQLNRRKALYLHHLGVMTILGGNTRQALQHLHEALKLDPEDQYIYNNLGNVYRQLGDHDKAIHMFKKAIDLDPKLSHPYNNLGYLFLNLGRFEEAVGHFQKSIALEPDIVPYVNLGITFYCLDNPQEGAAAFEKGLDCAAISTSYDIHYQLNKVSALAGSERTEEALDLVRQMAEKRPSTYFLKEFFSDWNLLASAPRPPRGIHDFIRQAGEILNYIE